jgi:hypothetical protein
VATATTELPENLTLNQDFLGTDMRLNATTERPSDYVNKSGTVIQTVNLYRAGTIRSNVMMEIFDSLCALLC